MHGGLTHAGSMQMYPDVHKVSFATGCTPHMAAERAGQTACAGRGAAWPRHPVPPMLAARSEQM
jgi:hypothetical protein